MLVVEEGAKPNPSGVTFASAIGALVGEKCASCPTGAAPFLVTYEQTASMGAAAKEVVARRAMPPWGAFDEEDCDAAQAQGEPQPHAGGIDLFSQVGRRRHAARRRSPTAAAAGARPRGLAPRRQDGRLRGRPKPRVEALAPDDLRCFPLDPGFTRATWVAESLVVPEDPKVVHHALVYIDTRREGVAKVGPDGSYTCFGGSELSESTLLLAWSPGGSSTTYGKDAALPIPKDAHLVVQVHYHAIATRTTGQVNLELKTLPEKPARTAGFVLVGNADGAPGNAVELLPGPNDPPGPPSFRIPANAKGHTETMELRLPPSITETRLTAVGAHMHFVGVGLKLEVERREPAEGEPASECLLSVPKYDFNWQRTYAYDAPERDLPTLRGGDKLRITCTYDNSRDNPLLARALAEQRMSKPVDVRLGGNSLDEMCQAIPPSWTPRGEHGAMPAAQRATAAHESAPAPRPSRDPRRRATAGRADVDAPAARLMRDGWRATSTPAARRG